MRVDCPCCYKKAIVTSSNSLCSTVKDLYCQCTNTAECGASFVVVQSFKHLLNPPLKTTQQIAASLIKSLPLHERKALQNELF